MNADTIQRKTKTPGLYLQGLEPGPHPPVVSGVTGFVGVTEKRLEKEPLHQPQPIKNWGEFLEVFGGFIPYGYLPRSVFGFFLNGGELCYVVRVALTKDFPIGEETRDRDEDGFVNATGILKATEDNNYLGVVAKVKGSAGNNIRVQADPFTTTIALKAPQFLDDSKHFITVHHINPFIGDEGKSFIITHEATSETITIDASGVEEATNRLVLGSTMVNKYPLGAVISPISTDNRFNLTVKIGENSEPLEVFYNLSMDPASGRYFKDLINRDSNYIEVDHATGGSTLPPLDKVQLKGGKDPGEIDYRYYTGYEDDGTYFQPDGIDPDQRLGLAALELVEDVSLVAIPDLVRGEGEDFISAQKNILFHCRKMGERFALLDPIKGKVIAHEPDTEKNEIAPPVFSDKYAKFGALYYPWVYAAVEGEKQLVPPSGFIAGIMARTDRQYGTQKAPANEKIKGVLDLASLIDKSVQDDLNEAGINCIRKFEDGMIKVWGARTLSKEKKEKKWRYINIRRTFLIIIKTLSKKLLWTVFEPNDKNLWKRIESSITTFLLTMAAKGKTAGTGPGDAFYVKCSEETNPQEIVDAGQVIAEIGVALTAPAEFIVITVKKTPESLNIIEEEV